MRRCAAGLALVIACLAGGCAQVPAVKDFALDFPVDWRRLPGARPTATREGPRLQIITVLTAPAAKAFPGIKAGADESTLPSELAEAQFAEHKRALAEHSVVEVLGNDLARLGDRPAYRLHLRYRTPQGLRIDEIWLGTVRGVTYYVLLYRAPSLHFFERDRAAFERTVATFRFEPMPPR